jgi:hypothetical protein
MSKDYSRWVRTPGKKCKGCYTTKGIYYRYTNTDGELAQSCEKCLDKVRKMLEDKGLWKPYSN